MVGTPCPRGYVRIHLPLAAPQIPVAYATWRNPN